MATDFQGKVILIAGEAGTLSAGIIHAFLKEEAIVIFPARSLHQVQIIKSFGDISQHKNFTTLLIDVLDFDKMKETCETITDRFGKIDIAIKIPQLSACQKKLTEASMDEWNNMMETDMLPFFMGARVVLSLMKGNLSGMFVHITDGEFLENLTSCALARVALTTRLEMSKIFAEEAQRSGIRYYHLWAQDFSGKEPKTLCNSPERNPEEISMEIMNLYRQKNYSAEMALQFFPENMMQKAPAL